MKTTKFITVLLAIFGFAFLSTLESCSKDEDPAVDPTKTELVSSSGWILNAATVDYGTGTPFDLYALMDACNKDDILFLKSDKSVVTDAGAIKCDPSEPQTEDSGTWAFGNNETTLILTDSGDVSEVVIKTLSSTELKIEFTEYDSTLQANIIGLFTYKH